MGRVQNLFGTAVITAALLLPGAAIASARQDDRHDNRDNHRYYDTEHKDYHNWNSDEDRNWREYLKDQHEKYRDFSKENKKQQEAYWNWRHEHGDHDDNGHH